jgi:hypothetical protein
VVPGDSINARQQRYWIQCSFEAFESQYGDHIKGPEEFRVPEPHNKITLVFIINGENFLVEANVNAPLVVAVEKALVLSGNTGRRDPREWEVRDSSGVLLEVDRTIKELGSKNGARLFLSLKVGAGGRSRP